MHPPIRVAEVQTAAHYHWGGVCEGWRLLESAGLSVIQERVPAGAGEIAHRHEHARQFFFVLSGTASLEFEAQSVSFTAGQGVHVAPGVTHRFANHSSEDVVVLVISAPPTHSDRIDAAAA
jgi:mannose-6-phosphate isomerase-like protein (cupin superfamily)